MNSLSSFERNFANGSQVLREVLAGLTHRPKKLPAKLLYDERGSELFEKICLLDDYYPWRSELEILKNNSEEIAEILGENVLFIEPGSGAGVKARELLEKIKNPYGYIPIEISSEILKRMTNEFKGLYPWLNVYPIEGDFLNLKPFLSEFKSLKKVIFFPGSTIGNLDPIDAIKLLKMFKLIVGDDGAIIIGFDLKKNPEIIERAYNDSLGVTAEFNLNLLERINREAQANFNLDSFSHRAFYNENLGRLEMHLNSLFFQQVRVHESVFIFQKGESIHTENSYKYSIDEFRELTSKARLLTKNFWTDQNSNFCVAYLESDYP